MKKLAIFFVIAALPATGQWRRFGEPEARPTGYFGVGVTAPVNPLASRLNTGWNLAGGVGVKYGHVGILLDAMYNGFGLTRRALIQEGARRGRQHYWAVTANPVFHVNPRGPIDFYVTAGAGIYGQVTTLRASSDRDRFDLISSRHTVKPGVNAGAGFAFNLGHQFDPKVFVEARYHHMFTRGFSTSMVPVTVGIRF